MKGCSRPVTRGERPAAPAFCGCRALGAWACALPLPLAAGSSYGVGNASDGGRRCMCGRSARVTKANIESCQFGCRVYRVHRLLRSIGPTKERDRIGPALLARLVAHNLFGGPRRRPPHASQGDIWAQGEPTRCGASLSTSTPSLSASERGRAAEHAKASVDDGCRSNKRLRRNMLLIFSSIVSVPELAAAQSFVASTIIVSRARRMRAARCLQSRPPMLPMLRRTEGPQPAGGGEVGVDVIERRARVSAEKQLLVQRLRPLLALVGRFHARHAAVL